jgi:hypothetical protein
VNPTLFDAIEGEKRRDAAIERVDRNADDDWKAKAMDAVRQVCRMRDEFTTDAVWAILDREGVKPPREPRALGAVMRRASSAGLIERTDRFVPTTRPQAHRKPTAVWRVVR